MQTESPNKIQILPDFIANQIAAGEVVEGPNSIVKELFENSVDANATKIDINVTKNLLKIEISDNGSGIAKKEISLAFQKHATSKIKTIEDLQKLLTNGFRGEALASIASVSKLTCISRTRGSELATKFYTENGKEEITETGSGFGTKIIVDDLFFNTPARLKFLKSDSREKNLLIDTCRGLALANPSIKVSLKIDGKNILESSGSSKLDVTLEEIFKSNLSKELLSTKASEGSILVEGFCSKISNTRTDKRGIFSIVNGRYLDCYIIKSAINSIYKDLLSKGKYPIVVLKVTLPTEDLDINVHPNKKEIKYREANKVYRLVQNALDKALRSNAYSTQEKSQGTNFIKLDAINSSNITQAKLDTFSVIKTEIDPISLRDDLNTYSNYPKTEFNFKSQQEESIFDFNSSKFIARFGSIDLKLIANTDVKTITSSQGNKTKFEYAHKDFKDNQSIIFSGEFIGENWIKEKLFNFLSELGDEIFLKEKNKSLQSSPHSRPQAKPKNSVLEKIWQRDNYTCVYCSKALLHPALIKEKLATCTKPNELNKHLASFDHHLPASKYTELNTDEENLYAVCQECNIKKSDSLASKTWKPQRSNAWENNYSIEIAELKIDKPTLN
jgi:DNA mismatch repair protein MutL